jgi:RHS repeat-associated protein
LAHIYSIFIITRYFVIFGFDNAKGTKLKKTLSTGKYTDYEEDEIFENGVLYQTSHDEGRIVNGIYEFDLKDHLGNSRVSFKDSSGIAKITQVNHVGAWGETLTTLSYTNTPKVNNFTYSTYEKENDFGIGVFDAHARMYDPILAKTWQGDPLSESYFHLSPNSFVANNPLIFLDPTGASITYNWGTKQYEEGGEVVSWGYANFHINDKSENIYTKGKANVYLFSRFNESGKADISKSELNSIGKETQQIFNKNGLPVNVITEQKYQNILAKLGVWGGIDFGVRINLLKGIEALNSSYAPGGGITDIAIREGKPNIFASNVGFDNQAEKGIQYYSTGFAAAHETLHQLLVMATYNENTLKVDNMIKGGRLMEAASFLTFHTNSVNNLNKDGSLIPTSQLRSNENILSNHKAIIIRYINRFSK